MVASFLVVALEFGFHVGFADTTAGVFVRFDCVVGGYVRGCFGVCVPGVEAVELGFDGLVATECAFDRRGVGFADRFAVPACAFGVKFIIHFLVGFACPFEGGGQGRFFDLVVMVDESCGLGHCVGVVVGRRELVRVPCQVDIKSRDSGLIWIRGDYVDVAGVLLYKASHCGSSGW